MSATVRLAFPDVSSAEKSRLARQLADVMSRLDDENVRDVEVVRERADTQDPGTIISLVLGAPAVVLAVKALAAWMVRANQTSVEIVMPGKTIIMRNLESEDTRDAIESLKAIMSP